MYGYVYKTTNLLTGKIYVGQHKAKKFDSNYKGSGHKLLNAFETYGKCNFKVELLDEAMTEEELNQKEIFWIKCLNAQNPSVGYNIAEGGKVNKVFGLDNGNSRPEVRQKISASLKKYAEEHKSEIKERAKNRKKGKTRKPVSEETRRRLSEARKKYHVEHPHSSRMSQESRLKISTSLRKRNAKLREKTGSTYTASAESRAKMSASHKGKKPWNVGKKYKLKKPRSEQALKNIRKANQQNNNKKVICINTGIVYNSIKEAAKDTGIKAGSISAICTGRNKQTKHGICFKYWINDNEQ